MAGRAVVVGGGGIGVASAYYLNRSGWDVTLVDKGGIGRGCSYGNAGLIVPSHSEPIPGPGVIGQALRFMTKKDSPFYVRPRLDAGLMRFFWQFRRYCNAAKSRHAFGALLSLSAGSLELYEELRREGDADFFFERRGVVEVALTEDGLNLFRHARDALDAEGFTTKLLSRDEALAIEPALSPNVRGGLFTEGEAHGSSFAYVTSLAATLEKRGARILANHAVSRLVHDRDRQIKGVELDRGETLEADLVVLAAGAWSGTLAKTLGVDIPLQPAKGYSCTIDTFEGAPSYPILVKERRVIVTPLDSRLRFAGTLELTGFDETIHGARYDAVKRAGCEILNVQPPMENEEPWSGLRPVTPDGLPIVDWAKPYRGLLVATGHAMLGFTQSPMTGKLVAELASGEQMSISLEPFRLDRF